MVSLDTFDAVDIMDTVDVNVTMDAVVQLVSLNPQHRKASINKIHSIIATVPLTEFKETIASIATTVSIHGIHPLYNVPSFSL